MRRLRLDPAFQQVVAAAGVDFDDLCRSAHAVVLFGSRAAGCATAASDWDLLLVGPGRSCKRAGLDLVRIEPHALESKAWLAGDLAGHIAAHGVWLSGSPTWDVGCIDFAAAARRKEERLVRSLRALAGAWGLLGPAYRAKHATRIRRDIQRQRCLDGRVPIPPSAWLDERWIAEGTHGALADTLLALLAAPPDVARDIAELALPSHTATRVVRSAWAGSWLRQ